METDFLSMIDVDNEGHEKSAADIANDPQFNQRLYRSIEAAPEGELTKEAKAGGLFIKRRQRERSVVRRLNDFETATDDDLVRLPDDDEPCMWGEIQNDTMPAMSLGFDDAVENETFWRKTFKVKFFVISSPEYYKNIWELKTHAHDTVKQFTEDVLIDIDEEEDRHWFGACEEVVGPRADTGTALSNTVGGSPAVGLSGEIQNFWLGAWSRDTCVDSKYIFKDRSLPLGTVVANHRYLSHFEKLPDSEIGSRAGDLFFDGADEALKSGVINGVPHLFTTKSYLVPNDVIFQFTKPDYLGFCREYQAPTMSMRREKRTIFFSVEEIVAMAIVHTGGILKGYFANHTDAA